MGIFAAEKATIVGRNLLDTLCTQLEELMSFREGERDLVMLQHKFVVEWANGDTVCLAMESWLLSSILWHNHPFPNW